MTQFITLAGSGQGGFGLGLVNHPPKPEALSTFAQSSASVAFSPYTPLGALDDFGVWDAGQPDAARTRVISSLQAVDTSLVRPYTTATKPFAYANLVSPIEAKNTYLWKDAVYAAVGVQWASMPNLGAHYVDQVQFEPVLNNDNYLSFDASSLEGLVCPYAATAGGNASVAWTTDRAYSGTHALKMVTTTGGTNANYSTVGSGGAIATSTGVTLRGSVRISASVAGRSYRAIIQWFDANMQWISSTTPGYTAHAGDGSWPLFKVSGAAPAGAAWASVVGQQSGTGNATNDIWYADEHWLTPSATIAPSGYQDPRQVQVQIRGERINFIRNPLSRATGYQGWTTTGSATTSLTQDLAVGIAGSYSLKVSIPYYGGAITGLPRFGVTTQTTADGTQYANIAGLRPGVPYVASVWVQQAQGCPQVFCAIAGSSTIGWGTEGIKSTRVGDPNYLQTGGWVRLYVPFQIQPGGSGEVAFTTYINAADQNVGINALWRMTDVVVEEGFEPGTYFDGSLGDDYLWEGTPNWSRSHYYTGRREKSYRLSTVVQENLPLGATFVIKYAPVMEQYNAINTFRRIPERPGSILPFRMLAAPAAPFIRRYY